MLRPAETCQSNLIAAVIHVRLDEKQPSVKACRLGSSSPRQHWACQGTDVEMVGVVPQESKCVWSIPPTWYIVRRLLGSISPRSIYSYVVLMEYVRCLPERARDIQILPYLTQQDANPADSVSIAFLARPSVLSRRPTRRRRCRMGDTCFHHEKPIVV